MHGARASQWPVRYFSPVVTDITSRSAAAPGTSAVGRGLTSTDALLAVMVLVWGVNYVVLKFVFREISPLAFNGVRFTLAAGTLAVVAWASGAKLPSRADIVKLALLGFIGNSIYQYGFVVGVARTRAGNAALIMAAVPVETAVVSHLLGHEKLRLRDLLGLLCSAAGIGVIVLGSGREVSFGGDITGDLLVFSATLCWCVYIIGCKPLADRYGPLTATAWTMGMGAIPILLYALPAAGVQDWAAVSLASWAGLIFSAMGALVISYLIWFRGVQKLGPSRTAFYSNITPVVVMLSAWAFLHETPTPWQIAGAAGIFTGLWLTRT